MIPWLLPRRLSTKTCVVVSIYVFSVSNLVRKNFSMTDIKKIIQCIIREIEDVNKPPYLEKFNDAPNKIPGLILTGEGRSLFVNRTIETNITKVADWYSNQRPELKEKCTTKEC